MKKKHTPVGKVLLAAAKVKEPVMSEIKAELVYTQRHSDGFYPTCYPSHRRDMAVSADTPHYIIPAAGVPSDDVLAKMCRDWHESNPPLNRNQSHSSSCVRYVLNAMGLREVE